MEVNLDRVKYHLFSKHDNRHTLESYGDHLGGPYGRKHPDPSINQHYTGNNNTKWDNLKSQYSSTYTSGYGRRGSSTSSNQSSESVKPLCRPEVDKSALNRFYPVPTKDRFTRFPKRYELPQDMNLAKPSVNTVWWFNSHQPPCTTGKDHLSLSVIGASQLPYLGKNTWKYAYNP